MRHATMVGVLGIGGFVLLAVHGVAAQVGNPSMPLSDLTFGQMLVVATNLGLSGVFLYFLLHSLRRQLGIEDLNRRYDDTQRTHLQTFRDINEAYRTLATDMHNASLLSIQVQTRLIEKLEMMVRRHEQ